MRSATKITSIVAAVGAGALGLGLVGFGTGVGANFTSSASGNAQVSVGTFDCQVSSDYPGATNHGAHSVTIPFPAIQSSAASHESAHLTVTNDGSMALAVDWAVTTSGHVFDSGAVTAIPADQNRHIGAGASSTYQVGAQWTELHNVDLGKSGTITYTATCTEARTAPPATVSLFGQDGGVATWDGSEATLKIPDVSGPDGAGINIKNVSSSLPANSPRFTTDHFSTGTPRFAIGFSDGTYAFGYPSQANPPNNWTLPGSGSPMTWNDVLSYATAHPSLTVTSAFIVADTSAGAATSNISCVDYSGTPLFGTGC